MKKMISIIIVITLGLSILSGCSGGGNNDSGNSGSTTTPTAETTTPATTPVQPTTTPPTTPEPTAEPTPEPEPPDDEPPEDEDELVEGRYFSYTAAGDWNYNPNSEDLKNEVVEFPAAWMEINWRINEIEQNISDRILPAYPSLEPVDDVTIAGITYTVLESDLYIFMFAPVSSGHMEIWIKYTDIEGAMPVLETIMIN